MLEIKVCIGSACHLKGSYNVLQSFQQLVEEHRLHERVQVVAQFCMRRCQQGVSVSVLEQHYSVTAENAGEFFRKTVLPLAQNA